MGSAAARHLRCAIALDVAKEAAEACYLMGLAAECAIKYHLIQMGFKYKSRKKGVRISSTDPIFLHFPDLPVEVLAQAEGIVAGRVLAQLGNASLLNGWSVRMRYAKQLSDRTMIKRFMLWKQQTQALFVEVGL
jgi:hypothetical protein